MPIMRMQHRKESGTSTCLTIQITMSITSGSTYPTPPTHSTKYKAIAVEMQCHRKQLPAEVERGTMDLGEKRLRAISRKSCKERSGRVVASNLMHKMQNHSMRENGFVDGM